MVIWSHMEQLETDRNGSRNLKLLKLNGAGEGNRTLVFSLEGCCSTIELHPRASDQLTRRGYSLNRSTRRGRTCSAGPFRSKPLTPADSPPILRSPSTT